MTWDTERRALKLFDEIADLDASEQVDALDRHCTSDPDLRSMVERMLAEDLTAASSSGFTRGEGAAIIANEVSFPGTESAPDWIGRYRIVREIGRGGMGVVYEAEQDDPARRVALKVIRDVRATEQTRRRFRREVQLLGRLQHPAIASVFDAGTQQIGNDLIPFFAMEFVDGERLDAHVASRQLELHEIALLFERLCEGVQHAHQKGVIHRDLKPSNILIRDSGDSISDGNSGTVDSRVGQPKILDFGVARFTDPESHGGTLQTQSGQIIGTLEFMSPEQVAGDTLAIDTRCDVYAIGVMLYQVLSGKKPFDLVGKPVAEAARIIQHVEPAPLGSFNQSLRGDLEIVVAKALEKDPDRRYASAAALGDDLRRYRTDVPIAARPPSAAYQFKKFASRNKGLVSGVSIALVTLILATIGMGVLLAESSRQRDRAETEAERSGRVAELMTEMVSGVNPSVALGRDTSLLRDILEQAAVSLDSELAELPAVEATMRDTIGDTLMRIAEFEEAERHLVRAMDLQRMLGDPRAEARTGVRLGRLQSQLGDFERAEELLREHGATLASELGADHPESLAAMSDRADALGRLSRFEESRTLHEQVVDSLREVAPASVELADALQQAASSVAIAGELELADTYFQESLALYERLLDADHPSLVTTRLSYGLNQFELERFEAARTTLARAVEAGDRVLGSEHPKTLSALNNLGMVHWRLGDREESVEIVGQVLERRRALYGNDHPEVANALNNLAFVALNTGDIASAERLYREVLEMRIRQHGERHERVAHATQQLAFVLLRHKGDVDAAAPMYELVVELRLELHGEGNLNVATARTWLGECRRQQGRLQEAEAILRQAVAGTASVLGDNHTQTAAARTRLGECMVDLERYDEAVELFRAANAGFLAQLGPDDASTAKTARLLAEAEAVLAEMSD